MQFQSQECYVKELTAFNFEQEQVVQAAASPIYPCQCLYFCIILIAMI